jgi:hypothetical protein
VLLCIALFKKYFKHDIVLKQNHSSHIYGNFIDFFYKIPIAGYY